MTKFTDTELINYYQNGDKFAYLEIYKRYAGLVFNQTKILGGRLKEHTVVNYDDISQEIHCVMLSIINNINPNKIKNKENFKLALSFQNGIKNYKKKLNKIISEQNMKFIPINYINIDYDYIQEIKDNRRSPYDINNTEKILNAFKKELNEREKEIFSLFYDYGMSYTKIAKELKVSKQCIYYWMKKIKYKFKKTLNI